MPDIPDGAKPILFSPAAFARHDGAMEFVSGDYKTRPPRRGRGRFPKGVPEAWGLLAAGGTITGASGVSLGSGSVKLCDSSGTAFDPEESVDVKNAGNEITGGGTGKLLPIDWILGDWTVCGCGPPGETVPPGVFCRACGGITVNAVTITDGLNTLEMFQYNGSNATFTGTDQGSGAVWYPTFGTTWITAVKQFDTSMRAPPTTPTEPCYSEGHLYYAYGLSCNSDGTVKLTLYLPGYIACDGLDSGYPRVMPWYLLFDEDGNFVFVTIERDLTPDCTYSDEVTASTTYEAPTVEGVETVAPMFISDVTVSMAVEPAPPNSVPCAVCNLPKQDLTLSFFDVEFGEDSTTLIYNDTTETWESGCKGIFKFKLECLSGIEPGPRLTITKYDDGCPDGTPIPCIPALDLDHVTCTPLHLPFIINDFSCSDLQSYIVEPVVDE